MNKMIRCKQTGDKAQITHWKHFHVNRHTGRTSNEMFTVRFVSGGHKNKYYVYRCSDKEKFFDER